MAAPEIENGEETLDKVTSVAAKILQDYFAALEKIEGYGTVADRLRKAVANKGVGNEVAIRAAIFDDSAP